MSNTRLFARALSPDEQALVYSMSVSAASDVAMLLPLPVPEQAPESSVRFLSLEGHDELFDDLVRAFEPPPPRGVGARPPAKKGAAVRRPPLVVHSVGDYEASFVPSLDDFDRLDQRFRLLGTTVDGLRRYTGWGFAVFQLRGFAPSSSAPWWRRLLGKGAVTLPAPVVARSFAPMALVFPRRDRARLFFPTLHIHDGEVHAKAHFDHTLYLQGPLAKRSDEPPWTRSRQTPGEVLRKGNVHGLFDPGEKLARRRMRGALANADVWMTLAG